MRVLSCEIGRQRSRTSCRRLEPPPGVYLYICARERCTCSYRRNFPSESLAAYNRTRPYCTCPHPVRPASRHKTLKSQETSVRASLARARRPTARAPAAATHARRRRLSPRLATQAAATAPLRAPHRRASAGGSDGPRSNRRGCANRAHTPDQLGPRDGAAPAPPALAAMASARREARPTPGASLDGDGAPAFGRRHRCTRRCRAPAGPAEEVRSDTTPESPHRRRHRRRAAGRAPAGAAAATGRALLARLERAAACPDGSPATPRGAGPRVGLGHRCEQDGKLTAPAVPTEGARRSGSPRLATRSAVGAQASAGAPRRRS